MSTRAVPASGVIASTSAKPHAPHRWQWALLICIGLALMAATYATTRTKADVRVTNPTYQDIESTVSTTGIVVPVNDFPARANFSGLVQKIYVKLGQRVRPGQMLLQMKDQYAVPKLETARAALDEAEVNRENVLNNGSQEDRIGFAADLARAQAEQKEAASNLDSMKALIKKGSVSEAEVDAATQRLDAANAGLRALIERMTHRYSPSDVASWKARIAADKAAVAAEKVSYENANVPSPIAGTVYLLGANMWDFVPAGTDLLHVADLSHLEIRAEFDEADLGQLHIGEPVAVTWDGAPGRTWHGRIESKPLAVTHNGGRSVGLCRIALEDDKGDLPVNTNVAMIVTTQKHSHVMAIPREALHTEGGSEFAYRVVDGKLERTPVEPGLANALNIEITKGLKADDAVVLHATDEAKLSPGIRVKAIR